MIERTELIDLLWEKAEPALYVTKEEFARGLFGWDIVGHEIDGHLAWITCQNGPEFHFQSVGPTRSMPRRMIRDFLKPIVERYGFALTKTPKDDERQKRFNLAFGFQQIGEDEFDIIFRFPHA